MHSTKCRFWGGVVKKFQISKKTKITETIVALNDLQSNYQTLLEQENVQINLPLVKFEYQKQVLKKLNNGALYKALRSIPIIHVAGTKVCPEFPDELNYFSEFQNQTTPFTTLIGSRPIVTGILIFHPDNPKYDNFREKVQPVPLLNPFCANVVSKLGFSHHPI